MKKFFRMKMTSQKGLTLIELILAVAISTLVVGAVGTVAYSVNRETQKQYYESVTRNDVRTVSTYLTNDIRYSQAINSVSSKELIVTDRAGKLIRYYLKNVSGARCLAREAANSLTLYNEIKDVNFIQLNEDLVSFDLITGSNNVNNFKVARLAERLENKSDDPENPENPGGGIDIGDIFIYSRNYRFLGSRVEAATGSIFVSGTLTQNDLNGGSYSNVRNIYIDGNIDITGGSSGMGLNERELGNIYVSGDFNLRNGTRHIYANVYVGGNAYIKDAIIHGDLYIDGDLELNWTPTFYGKAYYTGRLLGPAQLLPSFAGKCIKVDNLEPVNLEFNMPELRTDNWYREKGYLPGSTPLSNNVKIYAASSYSYNIQNVDINNAVIVSKGDVTISGNWTKLSAVIFAPYGKVTINGLREFEGVIISRDGVTYSQGGSLLKYKSLGQFFSSKNDYPFE